MRKKDKEELPMQMRLGGWQRERGAGRKGTIMTANGKYKEIGVLGVKEKGEGGDIYRTAQNKEQNARKDDGMSSKCLKDLIRIKL